MDTMPTGAQLAEVGVKGSTYLILGCLSLFKVTELRLCLT